ncbi:hypothetical protein KI387_033296 [Taxus chinensis]|uniref:TIR domain-containing protein n=1 Tax=Taxus chinensis TaxID=29808 RepID=A0AA38F148_TAXCH|nr:hypothetical protein KI387_033296 [Taxus chinensis]
MASSSSARRKQNKARRKQDEIKGKQNEIKEKQNEVRNAFEGFAPSLPSTQPLQIYDVFINHRGIDGNDGLANSIYSTLECTGLRAFLDKETLELGDFLPTVIQDAMRTASLHIAIFSKNYAQSPWCLAELSFMLKTGTKIIPIFYDVLPSDLRWAGEGRGIYAEAFSQHENKRRYESDKLQEWKMALFHVSFHSGWEFNKINNDRGMLLKSIVHSIVKMIKKVPLQVAKQPVGLDQTVQDFEESTIQSELSKVNVVGIVGMGGCGKTTLAKELYNRKILTMDRTSFVFDVRDAAAKNVLHDLQKKLLYDLAHATGFTFSSIREGKEILEDRLRSLRALIVLDDIDHIHQLEALLPSRESLGSGSLIIITTRDLGVLQEWGISSIYKMKGLDHHHAEQLFCWHAFLQPYPVDGFEDLVQEFLTACNGLPLSLKVLGGQLYRNSTDYWRSQLDKISRVMPQDIKMQLKVSYDALDGEEQEIFLDIACFFIREKNTLAITIWDGSGWSGLHSLQTLVNKSLVELDPEGRIRMHDHLRDLGREIANRQSPFRIWIQDQTSNIQKTGEKSLMIRGIVAATTVEESPRCTSHYQPPFHHLMELRSNSSNLTSSSLGLKLLVVKDHFFDEQFSQLSKDLVWLRWFDFYHKDFPSWLSLGNLRVLELYNAMDLEFLWKTNEHLPIQLREMTIKGAYRLQCFPRSIKYLKHLRKVCLHAHSEFVDLPEELCFLQSLEHLELIDCVNLSSLPSQFGNLANLRYIVFYGCRRLTLLPVSFKRLKHLQHLDLSFCENLTIGKDILENITKLEKLNFTYCKKLEELPHNITNQASLRELYLEGTRLKELPTNIDNLRKLQVVEIGSFFLKNLPPSLGNLLCLSRLVIIDCDKLQYLPRSVGNLKLLEFLKLEWTGVKILPSDFHQLANLQNLEIIESPVRELPLANPLVMSNFNSSVFNLPVLLSLKTIYLRKTRVSTIAISEDCCPNLEALQLISNCFLVEIQALPKSLTFLKLMGCSDLQNISGISGLVNLQRLIITDCLWLDELPSFACLTSLKVLKIDVSGYIEKIDGLEHLTSLEVLAANTRWQVPGITSLEDMDRLTRLQLAAANRPAIETCIQSIKKWPSEMLLSARAVKKVESIISSFVLPNMKVVGRTTRVEGSFKSSDWLTLEFSEVDSWNDEAIACFVINSFSKHKAFSVSARSSIDGSIQTAYRGDFDPWMSEGKWVVIALFAQDSFVMENLKKTFVDAIAVEEKSYYYTVQKGLLVTVSKGEELKVLDQFLSLMEI